MTQPPKLFISGHSHILKVKYDSSLGLLPSTRGSGEIWFSQGTDPCTIQHGKRKFLRFGGD